MKRAVCLSMLLACCAAKMQAQVTVNASGGTTTASYANLSSAFAAINAGTHTGAINIDISTSFTDAAVSVLNSSGAGTASYTSVVIKPSADNVVMSYATVAGRGVIELNGADNVTIDGDNPNSPGTNRDLTIQNTAANTVASTSCIRLATSTVVTSVNDNNIKNLILLGSGTGKNVSTATSTTGAEVHTFGIVVLAGANTTSATNAPSAISGIGSNMASGQTANNLAISNNMIDACGKGILVGGAATSNINLLTINDNIIGAATPGATTVYNQGIAISGFSSGTVSGNTIRNMESWVGSSTVNIQTAGIVLGSTSQIGTNLVVERNKITRVLNNSTSTHAASGIIVNLSSASNTTIRNNFISEISHTQTGGSAFSFSWNVSGIKLLAGTHYNIYHNTVHMFGLMPGTAAASQNSCAFGIATTSVTNVDCRNNIFSNKLTGGTTSIAHVAVLLPASGTSSMNLTLNNNAYYSNTGASAGAFHVNPTTFTATPAGAATYAGLYSPASFSAGATTPVSGATANFRAYTSILSAAGTNDNASIASSSDAPIVSNADLHLDNSSPQILHVAMTGADLGVATDFDGDARTAPHTIGGDEAFKALCSALPAPGATNATVSSFACGGGSTTLTVQNPSQGTGVSYQWEESADGSNWMPVTNATNASFTTTVSATTYYRAVVTCSATGSGTSAPAMISVVGPTPGNTLASVTTFACAGGTTNLSLQNATSGTATYQWESSPDDVNWTPVSNATNATYTATVSASTYYHAVVTCSMGGSSAASNSVLVSIVGPIAGNAFGWVAAPVTGFNHDVIANGVGNPSTSTTSGADLGTPPNYFVGPDFQFTASTPLSAFTMPATGLVKSFTNPGMTYELQSVTGNNALTLTGTNSGTLTLVTPVSAPAISLLVTSGNGPTPVDVTVTFTDATTQVFTAQSILDWFNSSSAYSIKGIGRVDGNGAVTGTGVTTGDNPRLWDLVLNLNAANYNKQIASITVAKTATGGISHVFAVTTASTEPTASCNNSAMKLTAYGAGTGTGVTYQWEQSSTFGGPYANVTGGSGATTTSYTTPALTTPMYYRLAVGCTGGGSPAYTNEVMVDINPAVSVSVNPTAGSICMPGGTPVVLTASGSINYSWSPVSGLTPAVGATVSALPASTTTYTVTGTDNIGCTGTATATITVADGPYMAGATAAPSAICAGGTSQLSANANCFNALKITEVTQFRTGTGQTPSYPVYVESGPDDYVEISNVSDMAMDASGLVYQLWTGTTMNRSFTIPNGTIMPPYSVMVLALGTGNDNAANRYFNTGGANGPLSSSTAAGHVIKRGSSIVDAVGMTAYAWPAASGVTAAEWTGNMASASGAAGAVRTAGADNNTAANWTVSSATVPQSIGTFNAAAGYTSAPCAFTYSWSPSANLDDATIANPVASNILANETYTVTVSNGSCTSTSSVTVTAGAALIATASSTLSTICSGESTNISSTATGGGSPYTYSWDDGNGVVSTSASFVATPQVTTTYVLTLTDNCGTITTANVLVNVNPTPVVSITGNSTVCLGGQIALSAATDIGTNNGWTGPGSFSSSALSFNIPNATNAEMGYYTFTSTLNGCTASATTGVWVAPNPAGVTATVAPDAVCEGAQVTLTGAGSVPAYDMNPASNIEFIDISNSPTATNITGLTDDSEHNISLPSFTYNGVAYTTARVGVNGVIALGSTTGDVTTANAAMPSTANSAGNIYLAPYWDDLDIQTGLTIKTETVGNLFIVQFTNAAHNNFVTGSITFQAQLDLTSGEIHYVYKDVVFGDPAYDSGAAGTVGIQLSSTSAVQYLLNTASLTNGQSITFTPASSTGSWAGPGYTSTNATDVFTATVASQGIYGYTVENSNTGCTTTATDTLHMVNPSVAPSVTIAASANNVCDGSSVTFTATPANGGTAPTYQWMVNGSAVGTGGDTYTSSSLMNGDIVTVEMTSNEACPAPATVASNAITMSVNAPVTPSVSVNASATTVCNGGTSTLTAVATDGGAAPAYQWYINGAPVTGATNFSYTASGINDGDQFYVEMTSNAACLATATVASSIVTINSYSSSATITASGPTTVCTGGTVTLTAGQGQDYQWSNGATTQSITVGAGSYSVVVTSGAGCVDQSNTVVVSSKVMPTTAKIKVIGATSVCAPNKVAFVLDMPLGSTTGFAYQWNMGGQPIAGATDSTYSADATGSYTVTISGSAGCTKTSAAKTATVKPTPVADFTVGGNTSFCSGGTVMFTAASAGTGATYTWLKNGATNAGTGATKSFNASGDYSLVVTLAGCKDTSDYSEVVTVYPAAPLSKVASVGSTTVCAPNVVALTLDASVPSNGASFQWNLDGTAIPGATDSTYNADTTGLYTLTLTTSNGCTKTSTAKKATVKPLPVADFTVSGATEFCFGGSVTFTAPVITGYTYTWLKDGNVNAGSGATKVLKASGVYTVVATLLGCKDTADYTETITVNALPVASIATTDPATFCAGDSATLMAAPSVAGFNYAWKWNSTMIDTTMSSEYEAKVAGTYTVMITDTNGCVGKLSTSKVVVKVNAIPTVNVSAVGSTTIASNGSVKLKASITSGVTWQWYLNGAAISGATGKEYIATAGGDYHVEVVKLGCLGTSGTITVTQSGVKEETGTTANPAGTEEAAAIFELSAFPNPVSGILNVNVRGIEEVDAVLHVMDMNGKLVAIKEMHEASATVDMTGYANGMYLIRYKDNQGRTGTIKINKQ